MFGESAGSSTATGASTVCGVSDHEGEVYSECPCSQNARLWYKYFLFFIFYLGFVWFRCGNVLRLCAYAKKSCSISPTAHRRWMCPVAARDLPDCSIRANDELKLRLDANVQSAHVDFDPKKVYPRKEGVVGVCRQNVSGNRIRHKIPKWRKSHMWCFFA